MTVERPGSSGNGLLLADGSTAVAVHAELSFPAAKRQPDYVLRDVRVLGERGAERTQEGDP